MYKINRLMCLLILFIILVAQPAFASDYNKVTVNTSNNADVININDNDVMVVELEAVPSSGYSWKLDYNHNYLKQVSSPVFIPDDEGTPGTAGIMRFFFTSSAKGSSAIEGHYLRSWEKSSEISDFSINVKSSGEFTGKYVQEKKAVEKIPSLLLMDDKSESKDLPSKFNWVDKGGCTPVKNQGSCGSCWAFANVGVFESVIKIKDKVERDISEQFLVSCRDGGNGCSGGWSSFKYWIDQVQPGEPDAGAVYEKDFPYSASNETCRPPHTHYEKLLADHSIENSVSALKDKIYNYGPVWVTVNASGSWGAYSGGVFSGGSSGGNNHAVVLVGWDDSQGRNGIWYIRNSWGTGWGEKGYMRSEYGAAGIGQGGVYVEYSGDSSLTADFDATTSIDNVHAEFTDKSSGTASITKWDWDFGDGSTSSEQNPVHNYQEDGSYSVTLSVRDSEGNTDEKTKIIKVGNVIEYCASKSKNSEYFHISNLVLGSFSNESEASNYTDFTNETITMQKGTSYNLEIECGNQTKYHNWYSVWVDLNGDGDFEDSGELLYDSGAAVTGGIQGEILIPESAKSGNTRMRVAQKNGGQPTSCESFNYGEVEDYSVEILDAVNPVEASFTHSEQYLDVTFSDTSTGDIANYSWDFGDNASSSEQNPKHTYSHAGSYTVSLTLTGKDGSHDTATSIVNVEEPPQPVDASFTQTINYLSVSFKDTSSGDIAIRKWDFGDHGSSSQRNPEHTYAQAGTYIVTLTVKGKDGGSDTASKTITVEDVPTPVTASFTQTSNNLSVSFTDTSSGNIVNRKWQFGDQGTSTEQNPVHTYAHAGTYNVTLTVTGQNGNTDTASKTITVEDSSNNVKAAFSQSTNQLTVVLSNNSTGDIVEYNWNFGDQETSASENPIHTYKQAGTYTVSLVVTGRTGISDTATKSITVSDTNPEYCESKSQNVNYFWINNLTLGSFSNNSGADYYSDFTSEIINVEKNKTFDFIIGCGGKTIYHNFYFIWIDFNKDGDFDDKGEQVYNSNEAINGGASGTITIPATAISGSTRMRVIQENKSGANNNLLSCGTFVYGEVEDYTINIGSQPSDVHAAFSNSVSDLSVTFNDKSTGDIAKWAWNFGDLETSADQNPVHTFKSAGTYNVSLTITGKDGSKDSTSQQITVTEPIVNYCNSKSKNINYFWINNVKIGSFVKQSDAAFYSDFTSENISLNKGHSYDIAIGCGGQTKYHNWYTIRVDLNKDGDFDDDGEILYDSGAAVTGGVQGSISIPASAITGTTRMRITQKNGAVSQACETFNFGEVEDYSITLKENSEDQFIVTAVNDNLDNNDLYLMSNGLKQLGYNELVSDTDVSSGELRQYLSRNIKAFYHTGHGNNGAIMTSDGSVTPTGTTINVENAMVATCLTMTDTSWKSCFGSNAQMLAGYTKVSFDGPDDDVVKNVINNLSENKSYPVSWYLSNNAVSSLSDRWCLYKRENNDIVEYSARTGNVPQSYSSEAMSFMDKDKKVSALNSLLNKYAQPTKGFTGYAVSKIERKTSGNLNNLKTLKKSKLSEKRILRKVKRYLKKKGEWSKDMVLDSITGIQRISGKNIKETVGYSVRYLQKAPDGITIRGNGTESNKTILITGKGKVVSFSKYWPVLKPIATAYAARSILSISDALNIASEDISRYVKAGTVKLVDVKTLYGLKTKPSGDLELVPAYGFKTADGVTIVVDSMTGELVK